MANGAFKFKDSYGNTVSFISGSGSNISFSGGTLDLSGMTGLTLGNLTLSGTTQNAISASHAASYLLTSSFNTYSGTTDTVIGTLQTSTSSLNSFTSSATTRLNSIEGVSGSYATTGSNLFKGNQTISGSIIPAVDNAYDLGSSTHQFRDLYLSSASLYIDGTKVLGSTAQELQITTDTGQSFKILEAGSDNITLQSADGNIELKTSGGGDVIMDPTTGVIALKGTTTLYAGNKLLSSDGNAIQVGNSLTVTGSMIVTGYIETQELRTTYISSSILYRSGSTKFGDELGDTHSFTGSLSVSGSISVPESGLISGSSQLTGSYDTRYVLSGSITQTTWDNIASKPSGIVSGSVQVDVLSTTNIARLATTGSNTFTSNQIVSGSLSVSGSLAIGGSTSTSQFNIYTSSVSTQNVMSEFWNGDYTSNTRNFIRVRNAVNAGSTMSSYFGQGQDGKTYIVSNDFTKNHIVIDGNSTFVGINKNTPNSQLDVNGNTTVSGSIVTTSNVGVGGSASGTYGTLSVFGGVSIKDNNNAKLEIGRYSSGAPNSYIKLGANSNSLRFTNAGDLADIMELTNSGHLGLGVTPSSWASDWTVFQIGSMSSLGQYNTNNSVLLSNNYYNATTSGAGPRYIANGSAGVYQISSGVHYWYNAASGMANAAMTLTNTMILNNSGHLGLGVTPSSWGGSSKAIQIGARMSVYNDGFNNALFGNNTYFDGSNNIYINTAAASRFYLENTGAFLWQQASSGTAGNTINFTTAMTLNASGNLGLGTTDTQGFRLAVDGPNVSQGDVTTTIRVFDTASATIGTGGGISFAGYFSGTSSIINTFSYIKGGKENSTGGDYASYLSFGTRINGASPTERLRITSVGTVQPAANGTQDLGTASLRWGTVYTSDLSLSNGIGDYTIVEGENDLFLYNNKQNKVYKFLLSEVNPSEATPKKS